MRTKSPASPWLVSWSPICRGSCIPLGRGSRERWCAEQGRPWHSGKTPWASASLTKPSNTHTVALLALSCCNPEFSRMQPLKLPKPKTSHDCPRESRRQREKELKAEEVIYNNDPGNRKWRRGTMEMEKGDSRQGDKKFLIPSLSSIISWWLGNLVRTGFLFSHKGPIYFHIFFFLFLTSWRI